MKVRCEAIATRRVLVSVTQDGREVWGDKKLQCARAAVADGKCRQHLRLKLPILKLPVAEAS